MAEITDPPSGGTVKSTTPVVSGTGVPGSIVTIRAQRDDQEVFGCRDVVAESGSWSCRFLHAVEPGTWDLDVLEVDQDRVGTHSWVTGIVIQGLETPPSATPEIPLLDTLEWPRKEEDREALPRDGLATPAPEGTRPHPDNKKEHEALPQDGLATPAPEGTRPHPDNKDWANKDGKDAKEHGKDAKEPRLEGKDWAHKDGKDAKEPRTDDHEWSSEDGQQWGQENGTDDHKWDNKDGKDGWNKDDRKWDHKNGKDDWNKDRKWDHKKDDKDAPYADGSQWPHTDGMGDPYRGDNSTDSTHAEDELPLTGASPAPIVMAGTALLGAGMIMLGFSSRRRPFQG